MIKISLGKSLEQRDADCDFCGESNKDCIKGSVAFKGWVYETMAKKVIDDLKVGFFSGRRYIKDYNYLPVIINKEYKDLKSPHICKDCIRQLAKLISL